MGYDDLLARLRADKCMVPADVPFIYKYAVRPISEEAAAAIVSLCSAVEYFKKQRDDLLTERDVLRQQVAVLLERRATERREQ